MNCKEKIQTDYVMSTIQNISSNDADLFRISGKILVRTVMAICVQNAFHIKLCKNASYFIHHKITRKMVITVIKKSGRGWYHVSILVLFHLVL